MNDWRTCKAIESKPGKVSGAWIFKGTRVPVSALFNNLKDGATIEEFLDWFPGVTRSQVNAVLSHQIQSLERQRTYEDISGSQRPKAPEA